MSDMSIDLYGKGPPATRGKKDTVPEPPTIEKSHPTSLGVLDGLGELDPVELFKSIYRDVQRGKEINIEVLNHALQASKAFPAINLQIHQFLANDAKHTENLIKLSQQVVKFNLGKEANTGGGTSKSTAAEMQKMLASITGTQDVLGSEEYTIGEDEEDE